MQKDWQRNRILPENAVFLTIIVCFLQLYIKKAMPIGIAFYNGL